ncbi:MAG: recombinase family protein [Ktedonobacteraceae bacterium]|nr:recombinase family protein [Ktedonobacteraceae bacterium]
MPGKPGKLARVSVPLPEPPAGIAFVGYVRYSSEMQDADSIVTQKREITALAQRKGWILAAFYKEPEHSAKYAKYEEVSKRPVFSRVLEDARAGKITGILSIAQRWGNAGIALDQLRRLGTWWQTVDQDFTINKIILKRLVQAFITPLIPG